jgi:SAM-dependent methyltransferase
MKRKQYLSLVALSEAYLKRHGDNYLGVGWTKSQEDADTRYQVMLEVIKRTTDGSQPEVSLLDFGCGASHLYEYMLKNKINYVDYSGLDLSDQFIRLSKTKFPNLKYYHADILEDTLDLPLFDYIVMNGVFNSKCELSFDEMFSYFKRLVKKVFEHAEVGIAFNTMSKQVDWERDDLFHLPFDTLASFLTRQVSRNFVIRHDYRQYEYTTYVYR